MPNSNGDAKEQGIAGSMAGGSFVNFSGGNRKGLVAGIISFCCWTSEREGGMYGAQFTSATFAVDATTTITCSTVAVAPVDDEVPVIVVLYVPKAGDGSMFTVNRVRHVGVHEGGLKLAVALGGRPDIE